MDIEWAIFNVIELMGSQNFNNKRISYVVAPLVLKEGRNAEFLNLLPNIFRKDMRGLGVDSD